MNYSENAEDRVGVLHFASTQGSEVSPVRVRNNLRVLDAALQSPNVDLGGGTEIAEAIRAASRLSRFSSDHHPVFVIFSDGVPSDDRYPEIGVAVSEAEVRVWLVALDADGLFSATAERHWKGFGLAGILELDRIGSSTVAEAFARIVTTETGQQWPP